MEIKIAEPNIMNEKTLNQFAVRNPVPLPETSIKIERIVSGKRETEYDLINSNLLKSKLKNVDIGSFFSTRFWRTSI